MQAGIELSDDEHDLDPFEDDLAVRGKGGRKTGGRQTGTADAAASAQQLQKVQRWQQCCNCVHHTFASGAMHRRCWLEWQYQGCCMTGTALLPMAQLICMCVVSKHMSHQTLDFSLVPALSTCNEI